MPRISIIIPVFNVEKYIEKCIQSVLNQTFSDFELIIINDGSTDSSGLICEKMQKTDSRINLYNIENEGVSRARNIGILKSTGDWICFIDSDDWVEKDFLENFEVNRCENTTLVIQGIMFRYVDMKKRDFPFFRYSEADLYFPFADIHLQKVLHNGCPVAKLFNRNVIVNNNIRFNEKISLHEDHVFCLEYLRYVRKIRLSSYIGYNYMRVGEMTLSKKSHPAENYIIASQSLIRNIEILQDTFDINQTYRKEIFTDFGLSQLLQACLAAKIDNYNWIFNYVKSLRDYFSKYYVKSNRKAYLLVIFCVKVRMPNRLLFYLISFGNICKRVRRYKIR